jgi:hypothetical protein
MDVGAFLHSMALAGRVRTRVGNNYGAAAYGKGMLSFSHSRSGGLIVLETIRDRVLHVLPLLGERVFM